MWKLLDVVGLPLAADMRVSGELDSVEVHFFTSLAFRPIRPRVSGELDSVEDVS